MPGRRQAHSRQAGPLSQAGPSESGQPWQVFWGGCCQPVAACLGPGAKAEGVVCLLCVTVWPPLSESTTQMSGQRQQHRVRAQWDMLSFCPQPWPWAPSQGSCGTRQQAKLRATAQVDLAEEGGVCSPLAWQVAASPPGLGWLLMDDNET